MKRSRDVAVLLVIVKLTTSPTFGGGLSVVGSTATILSVGWYFSTDATGRHSVRNSVTTSLNTAPWNPPLEAGAV